MLRYQVILTLVGMLCLSFLWSLPTQSEAMPTLEPLTEATPTATPTVSIVFQSVVTSDQLPPDTNTAVSVMKLDGGSVQFGYLNQPPLILQCAHLDASPIFAGLTYHQQFLIRSACAT